MDAIGELFTVNRLVAVPPSPKLLLNESVDFGTDRGQLEIAEDVIKQGILHDLGGERRRHGALRLHTRCLSFRLNLTMLDFP